ATVKQQVLEAVFEGKNNIPDKKIPEAKISDENECSAASGASCNSSSIGKIPDDAAESRNKYRPKDYVRGWCKINQKTQPFEEELNKGVASCYARKALK
ncbi:Hypothetical predicted protein, partial [Mytilus galloprovincialis]